jgi:mycothiol synthase
MSITLGTWSRADIDAAHALVTHDSLAGEFDRFADRRGLESMLMDPHVPQESLLMARADGTPAGLSFAFLVKDAEVPWTMLRIAVPAPHRRRGVGTRLLEALVERMRAVEPRIGEWCLGAYEPCPEAQAFAEHHGFQRVRTFWWMQRADDRIAEPVWPDGFTLKTYAESPRGPEDWTLIYNRSFMRHYHYVPTNVEDTRTFATMPVFDPTGLLIAYRDGRPLGFCRNEVSADRGEVALVGVDPDARRIGLGRALVRWGTRWLKSKGIERAALMVDGENESALTLYREEGFEIARTRAVWSRFSA